MSNALISIFLAILCQSKLVANTKSKVNFINAASVALRRHTSVGNALKTQQSKHVINLDCNGVLLKGDVSHNLETYLDMYQGPAEELGSSLMRLAQTQLFPSVQPLIEFAAQPQRHLKLAIRTFGHDMYQVHRQLQRMGDIPEAFKGVPESNRFQLYWLSPKHASPEFLLVRSVWGDGSLRGEINCGDDNHVPATIDRLLSDWGKKVKESSSKEERIGREWDIKMSDALTALGCESPSKDAWSLSKKIHEPLQFVHKLPGERGSIHCVANDNGGNETNCGDIQINCQWVQDSKHVEVVPCEEFDGEPLFGPIACVVKEQLNAKMSTMCAWKAWVSDAAPVRAEFHDAQSLAKFFNEELPTQVGFTAIRDHFIAHHSTWCSVPGFFRFLYCAIAKRKCKMCMESGGELSPWQDVNGKVFFPNVNGGKASNLFFDDNLDVQHIVSPLLDDQSGTRLAPDEGADGSAIREAMIDVPKDREKNTFPSEEPQFFVKSIIARLFDKTLT